MRISTNQVFRNGLNNMLDEQQALLKTQRQLASGKQHELPSDDPLAASRISLMNQRIDLTESYESNRQQSINRLSAEESILTSVEDNIVRLKELQVQANSGALNNSDRKSLAKEASQILKSLVGQANSQDFNGHYLFGGGQTASEPYTLNGGRYQYNGDETTRNLMISNGVSIDINHSGKSIFSTIKNGNQQFETAAPTANTGTGVIDLGSVSDFTAFNAAFPNTLPQITSYTMTMTSPTNYVIEDNLGNVLAGSTDGDSTNDPVFTAGEDISLRGMTFAISGEPATGDTFTLTQSTNASIFDTVQDFIASLEQPITTQNQTANFQNEMVQVSARLNTSLDNVLEIRAAIGARLNTADNAGEVNNDFIITSKATRSSIEDVDPVQAAVELNLHTLGLQAAQQSYIKLQGLSLFNFL